MAQSQATQLAIVLSAFFLPVLTYLYFTGYFTKVLPKKNDAGPLPPPTEITALYIHPVKSCHGIKVQSAKLLPTGLDLGTSTLPLCVGTHTNLEQTGNGCGSQRTNTNSSQSAKTPE
jgi:hypothetical protein